MATLNHLKKGESLNDKQLVIINSTNKDLLEQSTNSFTYTFDQPLERISKIDVMYTNIPKSFYNVNNDNATMSITIETFNETLTTNLVINDDEIKNNIIEATNIIDGTVIRTNLFQGGSTTVLNVVTKNTFVYVSGKYDDELLEIKDFTGETVKSPLSNIGLTDLFIAKFSLEQELLMRFKIAGILIDNGIDMKITDTDIYLAGMFTSFPIRFFNSNDIVSGQLVSDGNPTSFVCRYNISGDIIWKFKILGIDSLENPTKVVVDEIGGFIYVSGTYSRNLEIYNITDSIIPVFTYTYIGTGTECFIAKFTTDGVFIHTSHMTGNCVVRSMVLNPITNYPLIGMEYASTLRFYNSDNTTIRDILSLNGTQNLAIAEYQSNGKLLDVIQIGGSNIESDIKLDINTDTLAVTGLFTSQPVSFFNSNGDLGSNLNINGINNNIFIAKYDLITTPGVKLLSWATNIYDDNNNTNPVDISLIKTSGTLNTTEFFVIGNYSSLLKFNSSSITLPGMIYYELGQDLLNITGNNYTFMVKYNNTGKFQQRSYIEAPTGAAIGYAIDAHSNNVFIVGSFSGDIDLYNSDNTKSRTITASIPITTTGLMVSYINNINNYTINTNTLSKRIICKSLIGTDLNYILNLNSFSQQLGFTTSQKFQAMVFGTSINWTQLNVTSLNNKLTIVFSIGNKITKIFTEYTRNFSIQEIITTPTEPSYSPFSLAFELSKVIKNTLTNDNEVPFIQTNDAIKYDSDKNIFYLSFEIDGTFTVTTTLINLAGVSGLNLPNSTSPHCIISNDNVSNNDTIEVTDNSKLSIKLEENIINTRFNNVSFNTAFKNISSNSGSLVINAELGSKLLAIAGSTIDNISSDLQTLDEITFDSPWIQSDINENTFIDALKYRSIAISSNGAYQTAVVEDGNIYVSSNSGGTWVSRETKQKWVGISMTGTGEKQTAIVSGGQIYVSDNFGLTWNPRDSNRNWQSVAISNTSGIYQVAVVGGGFIYISLDFGASWIVRDIPRNYVDVAISGDGTKMTAVVFDGNIYISYNFGLNWIEVILPNTWRSVSMDLTGTIQMAIDSIGNVYKSNGNPFTWTSITVAEGQLLNNISVSGNTGQYQTIVGNAGDLYISSDTGENWTAKGFRESWSGIAVSDNGSFQVACVNEGGIFITKNYGTDWVDIKGVNTWWGNKMSSDGTIQVSVEYGGLIYISRDSGRTWNPADTLIGSWTAINMSADGQLIIAFRGTTYRSTDGGLTWNNSASIPGGGDYMSTGMSATGKYQITASLYGVFISLNFGVSYIEVTSFTPVNRWMASGISSDGKYMTVASIEYYIVNYIYNSSDFGTTWTKRNIPYGMSARCISLSADGKYQLVVGWSSPVLKSTNYGVDWTTTSLPVGKRFSVAMSANGQYQATLQFGGRIEVSTNYGVTWVERDVYRPWNFISMSSDGSKLIASSDNGNIFNSFDFGKTWKRQLLVQSNPYVSSAWVSSAISDDGRYITTCGNLTQINSSNNYGISFKKSERSNDQFEYIDMSSTGQYQTVVGRGIVYRSDDFGLSWTTVYGFPYYTETVAMTSDGSLQIVGGQGGGAGGDLYQSNDFGVTYFPLSLTLLFWKSIALSSLGDYRYACSNNKFFRAITPFYTWTEVVVSATNLNSIATSSTGQKVLIAQTFGEILYSNDFGLTFTLVGPIISGNIVNGVAISGDGVRQVIAVGVDECAQPCAALSELGNYIYISTDNWVTWKKVGAERRWSSIDMTNNGTQLVATDYYGNIHQSFDSGLTWGAQQANMQPVHIALSSNGIVQTILSNGRGIYRSTTSGNTWDFIHQVNNWNNISMSSNGQYQTAVPYTGFIYVSIDTGLTWSPKAVIKNWRDIDMDTTGQFQFAVAFNDSIYKSSDFGSTWVATGAAGVRNWQSISVSQDGTTVTAVVKGGKIYVSTTSGLTWTETETNRNWQDVAVSKTDGTGIKQTAIVYGGKIYYSNDTGTTWTETETNRNWQAIALSGNGTNQFAVEFGGQAYKSSNAGITWTPHDVNRIWWDVATSHSPMIQAAVVYGKEVYQSIDLGLTWSIQYGLKELISITMSNDGVRQIVAETGGQLYSSNDSGLLWNSVNEIRNWRQLSMNSNGVSLACVYGGGIYRNTDGIGAIWTLDPGSTNQNWQSIALSNNNAIASAVVDGGRIHTTINGGTTWLPVGPVINVSWIAISIASSNNLLQSAVVNGGNIYITTDMWVTFSAVDQARNWQDITLSSDGSKQTAIVQGGKIYTSINTGLTWTARDSDRNWIKNDMSSDGSKQVTIVNGGQIYTSIDSGVTWNPTENSREWRGIAMNDSGSIQIACDRKKILEHQFNLNEKILLNVDSIDSNITINDSVYFTEPTTVINQSLNTFDMANGLNYTIKRSEPASIVDIYIPSGNYTPDTLVDTINSIILGLNPAYIDPFSYNSTTGKISFIPQFSGIGQIELTDLLKKMGFTELPTTLIKDVPITGNNIVNPELSGPLNIFIKSDIIGKLRKHKTAFSTNKNLENLIAPLELHKETNTYRIPIVVEIYLSKKCTIPSIDLQIVDEQGNIVNLNGGVVQVNFYFYSS